MTANLLSQTFFAEELLELHEHLLDYGLEQRSLTGQSLHKALQLAQLYRQSSRNDLFALSLAQQESCSLLTGDKHLREAAKKEGVVVYGTIWLVEQLVLERKISVSIAQSAYEKMSRSGRRLPWKDAIERLKQLEPGAIES